MQPCLIAGFGVLRIDRRGLPAGDTGRADVVEIGFGPNLGLGLAYADHNVVAASEMQWLDAGWRSSVNLAVTRFTVGAGYGR